MFADFRSTWHPASTTARKRVTKWRPISCQIYAFGGHAVTPSQQVSQNDAWRWSLLGTVKVTQLCGAFALGIQQYFPVSIVVHLHATVNNVKPLSVTTYVNATMGSLCTVVELKYNWYCSQQYKYTYLGVRVKCAIFLSSFNQTRNFSTDFRTRPQYETWNLLLHCDILKKQIKQAVIKCFWFYEINSVTTLRVTYTNFTNLSHKFFSSAMQWRVYNFHMSTLMEFN